MDTVSNFLEFWRGDRVPAADPMKMLAAAYEEKAADLASLKGETMNFIVPGKDPRGRWIAVFDEGRVDEVANLASRIDEVKTSIKSISDDIAAAVALVGGPSQMPISDELGRLRSRIERATIKADATAKRMLKLHRGMPLDDLAEDPAVLDAQTDLQEIRENAEPQIADIEKRLAKLRAILERYHGV